MTSNRSSSVLSAYELIPAGANSSDAQWMFATTKWRFGLQLCGLAPATHRRKEVWAQHHIEIEDLTILYGFDYADFIGC